MDKRTPDKKTRLLSALEKGMTMVHLDARRPGVIVPANLKNEPHLLLNLSYRFDPPDLAVGEWGVRSTLTFAGSRFTIAVPWSALYAISSHLTKEFWMYPEDMPPELISNPQARAGLPSLQMPAPDAPPVEPDSPRAILREVVTERPEEKAAAEQAATPPRRGHLRLVK